MAKKKHKPRSRKKLYLMAAAVALVIVLLVIAGNTVYSRFILQAPELPQPPLKDLASARKVELGTLAFPSQLKGGPYTEILESEFSFITSDKELHWDKLRPGPTKYDFSEIDKIVEYAQKQGMGVQGHHLVWTEDDSLPKWLKKGDYSQTELLDLMQKHITTVVGRYRGKVDEWTVVNEPFTRQNHLWGLDNWWGDSLGGMDYIDKAFMWARAADPNAVLILNDFNNEVQNDISDRQYAYMKAAKDRGVPIDAIGMQIHVDATQAPSKEAMVKNMKRFGELGYTVYITEFDINSHDVAGSAEYKQQLEAKITADVARACIEAGNCVSITLFGITDRSNIISFTHFKNRSNLFTKTFKPKPAFYEFRAAWQNP